MSHLIESDIAQMKGEGPKTKSRQQVSHIRLSSFVLRHGPSTFEGIAP
jgi:hypothetical protein